MTIIKSIVLAVFLASCTSNTIYKKPKDLIPKKMMVNMLTDLYIAKPAQNVKNLHHQRDVDYLSMVYEQYGIDSARFSRSNTYYMSKIDLYEDIHKEVNERIQEMLKQYQDTTKLDKREVLKKPD